MAAGDRRLELLTRLVAELKECRRELARTREKIAIVGMACRFPGGAGLSAFWDLLASGGDAVTRGRPDGFAAGPEDEAFRPFGGYVPGMDLFDAGFFRIAPSEAEFMDPQQRLLLETCWEAIEDAGFDPARLAGSRTGVFVGIGDSDYGRVLAGGNRTASLYVVTGTSYAAAAGRIAFSLGFEGPALSLDTACSSSLVALHQAAAALQRREADLALVGGVSAILSAAAGAALEAGGMLASDGRCKTFDAAADGFVRGEGCGVLVLKRLPEAERDGDRIQGVLLGSAVNQDGASAGLTVPNGPAQERVIAAALARAGVEPASLDYLEAHGTGTELGDPIEVRAAAAVYGQGRDAARPLRIGSVKTNIGHLEATAGVAGVIKVLLAMERGVIPKHLHFRTPNPAMDWDHLRVEVTAEATPWPADPGRPSRAGVSSFGVAGTNAHVILERYAPSETPSGPVIATPFVPDGDLSAQPEARRFRLLPLSARSPRALAALANRYLGWLDEESETPSRERLSDAAWTAGVGRRHFGERAGLVFADVAGLREQLTALARVPRGETGAPGTSGEARDGRQVAFLFTGQGSQWPGMGRDLYESEAAARRVFDRCEALFLEERGESLLDVMFGRGSAPELLDRTEWAQPALFALESALAALWESLGIAPDVVLGHSAGELAAASAAGFFGSDDGMRFAMRRGALMGSLPSAGEQAGGMLAVFAAAPVVETALRIVNTEVSDWPLERAADNGAHQVVSGPAARLAVLEDRLAGEGIRAERLRTSHAFHSAQMDPILDDLEGAAPRSSGSPSAAVLVSNVTGRVAGAAEAGDPGYWRRQARAPVRFAASVGSLAELGVDLLVEIGPRSVLGPLAALRWPAGAGAAPSPTVLTSLDGPRHGGERAFLRAVAGVYEAGLPVAFEALFVGERRRRVALPTYPFQRKRYWAPGSGRRWTGAGDPLLGEGQEVSSGGYLFTNELDPSRSAWLGDCRAFGRSLAPAALYAALGMLASRRAAGNSNRTLLRDFCIERPLVWTGAAPAGAAPAGADSPAGRLVQVVLGADEGRDGGSLTVFSRCGEGDPWVRHATGRVHPDPGPGGSTGAEAALSAAAFAGRREALPPVAASDFYRRLALAGLRYGPSLRVLHEVHSDGEHAVAVVRSPPEAVGGSGGLHPVLMEACFQLAVGLAAAGDADGRSPEWKAASAWLPAGCESLWFRGPWPATFECHARVVDPPDPPGESETRRADLTFFEPGGEAFGAARGFAVRRTTRAAFGSVVAGLDELLYAMDWRASGGRDSGGRWSADFLAAPAMVAAAPWAAAGLFDPGDPVPERFAANDAGLEALARSAALAALESLGWERQAGARVDPEPLRRQLRIGEDFRGLFSRLLGLLGEAGVLTAGGRDAPWRVAAGADGSPVALDEPAATAKRLREDFPEFFVEIALLERCGAALAAVLTGRADGLELLFSGEPSASDLYLQAPGYRILNRLVGAVVAELVAGSPPGRRLRVLEVGAGAGGTTGAVLAKLPEARTDYAFTDISAGFFAAAERRFRGSAASIVYRALDIERDPGPQGFDAHRYDIVLAANVLHATRDLGASLRHCRRLLAPSGVLVALEGTRPRGWADLTFGLLPGWWRFDDAWRTDHALVGTGVWQAALAASGYEEVGILGLPRPRQASAPDGGETTAPDDANAVILARGPVEVTPAPGVWVVAPETGDGATGEALAAELERRGQTVVRAGAASPPDRGKRTSWRDLFRRLPDRPAFRGVIHLEALGYAVDPPAVELAADWEEAVASAEALVGGLRDAGRVPVSGVWFVTRGAAGPDGDSAGAPAGAALWGYGRAAGHEAAEFGIRMIDLDAPDSDRAVAQILGQELLFPDREAEVAWRDGTRWVPRLVRAPAASDPPEAGEATAGSASRATPPGRLRGDRVYLVSTGLGRFGLELADWLAEWGAGGVALYGGPLDPEAREVARRLRGHGPEIRVLVGDPSEPAAVARLLESLGTAGLPPLGGVFHGVDPAVRPPTGTGGAEMSLAEHRRLVLGAWNLHRATLGLDLDCFVLFSGFGGVVGQPGPPPGAAADALLHHLARRRRAGGHRGQALAWGRWSGAGDEAEEAATDEVAWMAPERAVETLSGALFGESAPVAAGAVDWGIFGEDRTPPALLSELTGVAAGGPEAPADHDLVSRLRAAPGSAARERVMTGFLEAQLQALLRLPSRPPPNVGFLELGMDSLMAVELRNRLEIALEGEYRPPPTIVFDHPNITRLANHLLEELSGVAPPTPSPRLRTASPDAGVPIALIGLAGRFPGAPDVASFARGLAARLDGIRPQRSGTPVDGLDRMEVTAGYLEEIDRFDAGFFGISVAEARFMEPQQRLLLESSWHALEDAGIAPRSLEGSRTGVYAALGAANREFVHVIGLGAGSAPGMHALTGSSAATAVGRIAYLLGLEGPAVSVDTSCSSSLVAVHQAILDLERGDTDLGLAGGANVILSEGSTGLLIQSGLLSARGRCSAFDASADGYVRGEGCGIVVLKRLADAEAAGDRVLAVIRGSAVNQDGARSALSAPAGPGQRRVMEAALRRARLDPSEVDYLEAHGIGSALGDPIEAQAAASVYGRGRPPGRPLLLGSVKANIGHLEAAAGVVAVIKAVLAIRSRVIPPQLHFERPNPQIAWREVPLRVVTEPERWPGDSSRPRRAAVSAFGVSGTNAHLILETHGAAADELEAVSGAATPVPVAAPDGVAPPSPGEDGAAPRSRRLLPLSARTPGALRSLAARYLEWINGAAACAEPLDLVDVAWSSGVGRNHWEHRAGLVFEDLDGLRGQLREVAGRRSRRPPSPPRKVALLFCDGDDSGSGWGRILYETEPVARAVFRHCDRVFGEGGGTSLVEVLHGKIELGDPVAAAAARASVLYALEAALSALWSGLGVFPAVVSGAGVGAFASGYAAGVLGLDDGLRLAALRGLRRGLAGRRGGALLVCDSGARTRSVVREAVADRGAPELVALPLALDRRVVSGLPEAVASLEERLAALGEWSERVPSGAAAVGDLVRGAVTGIRLREPSAAMHSREGRRVRAGRLRDPAYWQRRVIEGRSAARTPGWPADPEVDVCIEVGPRRSGEGPVVPGGAESEGGGILVASPYPPGGVNTARPGGGFPDAVAQAYEGGVDIRFSSLFGGEQRRRVALPGYPFRRPRCWPVTSPSERGQATPPD